ncbi:hypothetical protein ACI2LJ_30640 [Streptomyces sp. NPDC088090]|uniref:hypothetical protein n=1 Tax=Streptomyces sp. NPDC088090 TaxID=3365822 RepID=UPI00384CC36C
MKDGAAAGAALAQAELLLDAIQPGAHDPQHLAYFTPERLAADAIEIHRDLGQPQAALSWNRLAEPMPAGRFTRAVGIRHAVLASSHIQAGDLDRALTTADRALGILSTVQSSRQRNARRVARMLLAVQPDTPAEEIPHDAVSLRDIQDRLGASQTIAGELRHEAVGLLRNGYTPTPAETSLDPVTAQD